MTENTQQTEAGVKLSKSDIENAKKEGALEYIKKASEGAMATDTGTTSYEAAGETDKFRMAPDMNTTFLAPVLDEKAEDIVKRIKDKDDASLGFEEAKALLTLERSGKNRTGYVKALMGVIGVKSPYEVTSAGPAYTNDETAVTEL